jgi:hypothetical protein
MRQKHKTYRHSYSTVCFFICIITAFSCSHKHPIRDSDSSWGMPTQQQLTRANQRLENFQLVIRRPVLFYPYASLDAYHIATSTPTFSRAQTRITDNEASIHAVLNQMFQWDEDLLLHELCHVAIIDLWPSTHKAFKAEIPMWFKEGLCSVVAQQTSKRMPLTHAIHKTYELLGRMPTLHDLESLFAGSHDVAYSLAHYFILAHLPQLTSSFERRVQEKILPRSMQQKNPNTGLITSNFIQLWEQHFHELPERTWIVWWEKVCASKSPGSISPDTRLRPVDFDLYKN